MTSLPSVVCTGCGATVARALPFRCPDAERPGIDHVLARLRPSLSPSLSSAHASPWALDGDDEGEPNPFIRYRSLSLSWEAARSRGLSDDDYVALVRDLDQAVAAVEGRGFAATPYRSSNKLAPLLGLREGGLWIKDETGNVAGSHKARHLFGLAIHLAVVTRTGLIGGADAHRPLAIASCGNAALAAAVIARAIGRRLLVFVPEWAEASIIARLTSLGAAIEFCPRRDTDPPGDPCHHRFREAVAGGALPFCAQGSENGLTIDGGMTLGFEMAGQSADEPISRLLIQVGGGALASSVMQALQRARDFGARSRLPSIHAVQTAGGFPLVRAWRRVARALAVELNSTALPGADDATDVDALRADAAAARWLTSHADAGDVEWVIRAAARDRARFMWPWQTEPRSLATGILDDETYDWVAVVRGMLTTGGFPVVASEANILEAYREGRGAGIEASATGTAGLAGAMAMSRAGLLNPDERVALLFTGVDR